MSTTLGLRTKRVEVLVSDSSRMTCELLVGAFLRNQRRYHFAVTGTTFAITDTLEAVSRLKPHVLVLNAHLTEGHLAGFRVLRELQARHSPTRTILLLDEPEADLIVDAFRGGARGVFYRHRSVKDLCKCVVSVHSGQVWIGREEMDLVLVALGRTFPLRVGDPHGHNLLTKRETDVVRLVAEGLKNREISRQLNLSEHTVRNYLFRIFEKLGISTRVELVLHAVHRRTAEPQMSLDGL